jgi:hypothetical protein
VKEARLNGVALANAAPQRRINVLDVGEGYVVAGVSIEPVLSFDSSEEENKLAIILTVVGGRKSDLVPTVPVKLVVGELASLPLSKLREKLAAAIGGDKPEEAA